MTSAGKWYFKKAELAQGAWDIHVDPQNAPVAGWKYTGLRVGTLSQGARPLRGSVTFEPDCALA